MKRKIMNPKTVYCIHYGCSVYCTEEEFGTIYKAFDKTVMKSGKEPTPVQMISPREFCLQDSRSQEVEGMRQINEY